jgi:hypothetical protein
MHGVVYAEGVWCLGYSVRPYEPPLAPRDVLLVYLTNVWLSDG